MNVKIGGVSSRGWILFTIRIFVNTRICCSCVGYNDRAMLAYEYYINMMGST